MTVQQPEQPAQPVQSATPGRTEAFYHGVNGTPSMVASGLAEDSQRFNDQIGRGFTPHSVLQFHMPSGNGMSEADKERLLPGGMSLMSPNGVSESNYENVARMKLMTGQT